MLYEQTLITRKGNLNVSKNQYTVVGRPNGLE